MFYPSAFNSFKDPSNTYLIFLPDLSEPFSWSKMHKNK